MSSVIISHLTIFIPAVASGLLAVLLACMNREHSASFIRLGVFLAASLCIIAVLLMTLVKGGGQEEIVCYLLLVLVLYLAADRLRKGGIL